jgi:hypothetical protein
MPVKRKSKVSSSSVIWSVPARGPSAVGVNVTVTVHVALGSNGEADTQVLDAV